MSNNQMSDILSELENAAAEYKASKQQREDAAGVLATYTEKIDEILARLREEVTKPDYQPTFGSDQ